MKKYVSVILSETTRNFDKLYQYQLPQELINNIRIGQRVMVPFGYGNKLLEGIVYSIDNDTSYDKLKNVRTIIDDAPILKEELIQLISWMREKYICTYYDVVKTILPTGIGVKGSKVIKLIDEYDQVPKKLKKIIETLIENNKECEYQELKGKVGPREFQKKIDILLEDKKIEIFEEMRTSVREKSIRVAFALKSQEELLDLLENDKIKKIQDVKVLEILLDNEYVATSDIIQFAGVSNSILNRLKRDGFIDFKKIEVKRDPIKNVYSEKSEALIPTKEQMFVIEKCKEIISNNKHEEVLLHGITGSGKTEVYLQLIQHVLDNGKEAIVLVPEISLTPMMINRFKGRFGDNIAVLHSRLSLGERYDQWRLIKEKKKKIVIGARSAMFAPLENIGIIIIDEEHESSYKSEKKPKYSAREIAKFRGQYNNALVIYGSATPSIDTYYKAKNNQYKLLELTTRTNNMVMPNVMLVDMRRELENGNRSIFSGLLNKSIGENLESKKQTMLFLNRRGYSSFILCRSCGYVMECKDCNVSLTYHLKNDRLICHYCGHMEKKPSKCPICESENIRSFGGGTQKVEEGVYNQFENAKAIRMDLDTTTKKNSHEEILNKFEKEKIDILIGTQMIAKGHDFENVTLVGVLAADSLLNTGDYRATERTFQLLTQVAGRAGRGQHEGRVIIQAYNVDNYSITNACEHDFHTFYKNEIALRKELEYPPFTNIGILVLSGEDDEYCFKITNNVLKGLKQYEGVEGYKIIGLARAPITKIKNKFRWRIVVKCFDENKLTSIFTEISDKYYKNKCSKYIDLNLDINPISML
jgi:primosomal protein N' (replication factor Y)